ncbi:transposase [Streptomyces sp. NPDC090119]|uniref:transposase n=1 Tax=Streptomyces sp. NPDC090119 TaxID=3365951 RepID=UPI0037F2F351
MSADLSKRLVPDELWELVAPLLPSFAARPQGGGTAPRDERAVFTAVVYVPSDAQGVPLAVAVSGANMHDSLALEPLILGIPAVRSRRGPRRRRPVKLRADKAHFPAEHLSWLRERGLVARIARPGIEPGERLGRHRWKIERSIAWLFGYRRLTVRYERNRSHFLAFLGLAAALTRYEKLGKLAT